MTRANKGVDGVDDIATNVLPEDKGCGRLESAAWISSRLGSDRAVVVGKG